MVVIAQLGLVNYMTNSFNGQGSWFFVYKYI